MTHSNQCDHRYMQCLNFDGDAGCRDCGKVFSKKFKVTLNKGVHLAHCNQGEYEGSCKYGDLACPSLIVSEQWPASEFSIKGTINFIPSNDGALHRIQATKNAVVVQLFDEVRDHEGNLKTVTHIECKDADMLESLREVARQIHQIRTLYNEEEAVDYAMRQLVQHPVQSVREGVSLALRYILERDKMKRRG